MRLRSIAVLILVGVVWFVPGSLAGTRQDTLELSVTVVSTCVATTASVNFGPVQLQTLVTATGQINVQCNGKIPYDIALNAGLHYNGSWRGVSNGTERLNYGLYAPSSAEWGDAGYEGSYAWGNPVSSVGTGALQSHVVTGRLFPSSVLVQPGYYSDTVKVTLHF